MFPSWMRSRSGIPDPRYRLAKRDDQREVGPDQLVGGDLALADGQPEPILIAGRQADVLLERPGREDAVPDGTSEPLLVLGGQQSDGADLDQVEREQVAREPVLRRSAFPVRRWFGNFVVVPLMERRGDRPRSGSATAAPGRRLTVDGETLVEGYGCDGRAAEELGPSSLSAADPMPPRKCSVSNEASDDQ